MKRNLHKIVSLLVVFLLSVIYAFGANITGGTKLYLKVNSNWKTANARFAAYFCNGTASAQWADMTKTTTDTDCDIYEVTVPSTQNKQYHQNVLFCRMNPSTTANNFNNGVKWTQTGDLVWDGTKSLFVLKDDSWDAGVWVKYGEYYVAGDGAGNSPWCNGKDWDAAGSKLDANGAVTFSSVKAGTYNFKITHGNWDATSYGSSNLDVENSTKDDCRFTNLSDNGGNIQFTTTEIADITITFTNCKITITAEFANPIVENYVLMGVGNDWETGIALQQNPSNPNELMLLGQPISKEKDAIKIVKKSPCGDVFYAEVDVTSSVPYSGGGTGAYPSNIVLEDGVYDFYWDKTTGKIRIEGNLNNSNKVYLDPQVYDKQNAGTWMSDGARMAVYCYKSSGDGELWVTAASCGSEFYAQIPAMYDMYIWCRMDPAKENNWEGRWNQTSGITYDAENTLTKLTGWADNDSKVHYQTKYTGICGVSYDDCEFPEITGDTVYVHINQFVESDPCNYLFNSFEQAFAVLKTNPAICSTSSVIYGALRQDVITLVKPVVMLVHFGPEYYRGFEKVGMSGGHINDAPAIFFRNINRDGNGKTLVVRTADPKGNRAVLVHPVIRRSTNIILDNLDIISDKNLRDNALDIDTGEGDNNLEGLEKDFNIVPLSDVEHNITLKNCYVESYGRNGIHVVGIKGIHVENNEFYTKYDFNIDKTEGEDVVDWGGTIKFINTTDVKFLRNNSEGTLATSFFIQGCQRVLIMNNVFWNDNSVVVEGLKDSDRTVANVRLVNFGTQAANRPVKNIGIYYNTFFIKNNDAADDSYNRFDFFRLGGLKQPVIAANFDPNTIRFHYNNCYSYDKDIVGNNDDETNATTFYLQSIGKSTAWCKSFMYNNFWSEFDKTSKNVSSAFEIGKFCIDDDETYNLYANVKEQTCQTEPTNPASLVVVGGGLNIGKGIEEAEDVSLQGAHLLFSDRLNADNGVNSIRPKMAVDNSNESLTPYDKIYKEPGTINLYTSPIVGSETTDVMISSLHLTAKQPINLSLVDKENQMLAGELATLFTIKTTNGEEALTSIITTDDKGDLKNEPVYIKFIRPTGVDVAATYEVFLKVVPSNASDAHLILLIPIRGHYIPEITAVPGTWTVGAFQQRQAMPVSTIIWNGTVSNEWDNRNNWYKEDGTLLTCLDVLTEDLKVIIPDKDSEKYLTPPEGITKYPSLPDISTESSFRDTRYATWHGEQVNAGDNTQASTTKVADKIYLEYGATLVGVEGLNKGVERYTEVEQEFVARRNTWLLAGAVVRPWLTDENGKTVVEAGKKQTRLACSRDYYRWHVPQVYMHQAIIDAQTSDATWGGRIPRFGCRFASR